MASGENIKIMKVKDKTQKKIPLIVCYLQLSRLNYRDLIEILREEDPEGLLVSKDCYMQYTGQVR